MCIRLSFTIKYYLYVIRDEHELIEMYVYRNGCAAHSDMNSLQLPAGLP